MKRKTVIKMLRIIIADETSVYDMSSHLKSIVLCTIFCLFVFFFFYVIIESIGEVRGLPSFSGYSHGTRTHQL